MAFTIKHKHIKGELRPFIVTKDMDPLSGYKTDDSGIQFAPLRPVYRDRLVSEGGLSLDELPDFTTGYKWPAPPAIKPYIHQKITTEFMIQNHRNWVLNKMRSGKTLSTIWAIDRMMNMGVVKKTVILAPLSIVRSVWQKELFMVMPQRSVYIADESVEDLYNRLKYSDIDIVVMNHDKIRLAEEVIDQWGFDLMVVDEAGAFRAVDSDRVNALSYVMIDNRFTSHRADRRFIALTATPVPQSPMDIWRLGQIINPDLFPTTMSEYRGRVMYSVTAKNPNSKPGKRANKITMHKPKSGMEKYIQSLIQPAIKFNTEDCIDMPPEGYVTRNVNYTAAQKRALAQMEKDHASIIKDIMSGEVEEVVAANAAVALNKYLQICGGTIIDNDGVPKIVGADARVKELKAIADEIGPKEKMVIMCLFTDAQKYIAQSLKKHGIKSLFLIGKMSGRERDIAVRKFQEDDEHRAIIVHPQVGQYGLNLSRARTMVWWTPVHSCDFYVQGCARIRKPKVAGKTDEEQMTTVVRLSGGGKEDDLYERLLHKEARQDSITEVFRRVITNDDIIQHK